MHVYQAIAQEVRRLGVDYVFTFMSEETSKLTAELSELGVTVVHARHEHIAVGMADGYSRASGGIGVAIVGQGPGLTNAANALTTAAKAHSRVLVLAGDSAGLEEPEVIPGVRSHIFKGIDQPSLLNSLTVTHVELRSAATAAADIAACFAVVANTGCVLTVNMPEELLDSSASNAPSQLDVPLSQANVQGVDVKAIADLFEAAWAAWASRHPIIVAGRGAVRSGARESLLRLSDITGALLGTTVMAKGLFSGEAYNLGVVGTFSTGVASELLGAADLILVFGASLNQHTTYFGSIFGKARVIQIDKDPRALSRYYPTDMGIVADARLTAEAVASELERRGHRSQGYRTAEVAERLANFEVEAAHPDRGTAETVDPARLWMALDRLLPVERTIVVDAGNHMEFPIVYAAVPDPRAFLWPIEYAAIGCGLGNALGAAIARPDRMTVLAVGDGGLMMALADLDTAVRYGIPLLVIVSNNFALGSELHYLRAHGYRGDDAFYKNPPFEDVARSLGFEALTVTSITDLDRLAAWLPNATKPMLLDCRINPDIVAENKVHLGM